VRTLPTIPTVCAIALLGGCSGLGQNAHGNDTMALPAVPNGAVSFASSGEQHKRTRMGTLTILIRKPAQSSHAMRGTQAPRYVSAATRGLTIAFTGASSFTLGVAITPADKRCSISTGTLVCTISINLAAGMYAATVNTYTKAPVGSTPAGSLLSTGKTALSVVTGKANKFPLTLDGVPASFFIGDFPFAFVGHAVGATPFTVAAKDAGGDTIVGTYTTPITLTDSDTTGATSISTAGTGAPAKELLSSSDVARISYNGQPMSGAATIGASAGAATSSGAFVAHTPVSIFVATGDNGQVYKIPVKCSTGACFVSIGAGFPRVFEPLGVAIDGSGSLYVADAEGGRGGAVYKTTQTCTSASCVSTIGGGFVAPQAVAADGHGNIYVADSITGANSGAVYKVPAGCTASSCVVKIGGTFGNPDGVAVDGSGNVYVADAGSSPYAQGVYEIPAGCTRASCVAFLAFPNGGWRSPAGVAVDASDDVYVIDGLATTAFEIPKGCGYEACVLTIGGGFSAPYGVAIDASGTLYVSTANSETVTYLSPSCASSACVYGLAGSSFPYGGFYGIAASPPLLPATVR
jgi:hypothetical protein